MIDVEFFEEEAQIITDRVDLRMEYNDLRSLYEQLKNYYTEQGKA